MLTRTDTALDRPMILFEYIVEILHRSMSTVLLQSALGFELHNRRRVSGVLVGVDDPRLQAVRTSQGFGQKALGSCCVPFGREQEVDRRTGGVHRAIQIYPLAFDPDVRLVDTPRVVGRFESRAQTSSHFRGITLYPSPNRDMIGVQGLARPRVPRRRDTRARSAN